MSAIVISQNDEERITRTVSSVVTQECAFSFEVIVVTSGSDRTAAIVRDRFPSVTIIELPRPALPGEARNAGLLRATGVIVSFPGSHVQLPQGSLAARMRAHQLGYAMVTGSVINGTATPSGWASYFLDHYFSLPNRHSGQLRSPPAHCSYLHEVLDEAGGFPADRRTAEDTIMNRRLFALGYGAYRSSEIAFVHHSPCRDLPALLRHHFVRGRGLARILRDAAPSNRAVWTRPPVLKHLILDVPLRLLGVSAGVIMWGRALRWRYVRVLPLVVLGATAHWMGLWYELSGNRKPSSAIHG